MRAFNRILNLRLWSLFIKEFHQIRRNRRLVILLIIPPTLNIILFGLALNPTFENLRLGVVDDSSTTESTALQPSPPMGDTSNAPSSFLSPNNPSVSLTTNVSVTHATVTPRLTILYNPGLKSAWFITTGMIGLLLVLQGSVVSSASLVREKEIGTVEQLLMTPAESSEIIVAKVAPIFLLLAIDIGLALGVARLVFGVPVRGSLLLFFLAASLCVLCGIGLGMMIATFTRTQQQAQLMGFFTNPPLALLSGATTPIEAMPAWLPPVTSLYPVNHFAIISCGILLKGSGVGVLYQNLLALAIIALVMISLSAWRFRKQLG